MHKQVEYIPGESGPTLDYVESEIRTRMPEIQIVRISPPYGSPYLLLRDSAFSGAMITVRDGFMQARGTVPSGWSALPGALLIQAERRKEFTKKVRDGLRDLLEAFEEKPKEGPVDPMAF